MKARRALALVRLLGLALLGLTLLGLTLLGLTACSSAFGRALERGDQATAARDWETAAVAYGEAARLDPEDEGARLGLARARQARLAARLGVIDGLTARGNTAAALDAAAALVAIEPAEPHAVGRFDALAAAANDQAETALGGGRLEEALGLAEAALTAARTRPLDSARARRTWSAARAGLVERALAEAAAAMAAGRPGRGLLALASLESHGIDEPRAAQLAASGRAALREEATWRVAVAPTEGDPSRGGLGAEIDASRLQASLDPAFAIRLVPASSLAASSNPPSSRPERAEGSPLWSVTLAPSTLATLQLSVRTSPLERARQTLAGACTWVCGTTTAPNPRAASLRASIDAARDAIRRAERRVDERGGERRDAERAEGESRQAEETARADADAARRDLGSCRSASSGAAPGGRRCAVEEQAEGRAERAAERAAREFVRATEARRRAEEEEKAAARARDTERRALDLATQALATTPPTLEVERTCDERYDVDEATVVARASVRMVLQDGARTSDTSQPGVFEALDRGHAARPGTCRELATADPLELPDDQAAARAAVEGAVVAVRQALVQADQARRAAMLAEAGEHRRAGRWPEATELWARWIAGATDRLETVAAGEAATALGTLHALPPSAVVRSLRGR